MGKRARARRRAEGVEKVKGPEPVATITDEVPADQPWNPAVTRSLTGEVQPRVGWIVPQARMTVRTTRQPGKPQHVYQAGVAVAQVLREHAEARRKEAKR